MRVAGHLRRAQVAERRVHLLARAFGGARRDRSDSARPSSRPDSPGRTARARSVGNGSMPAAVLALDTPIDAHTSSSSNVCDRSPAAGYQRTWRTRVLADSARSSSRRPRRSSAHRPWRRTSSTGRYTARTVSVSAFVLNAFGANHCRAVPRRGSDRAPAVRRFSAAAAIRAGTRPSPARTARARPSRRTRSCVPTLSGLKTEIAWQLWQRTAVFWRLPAARRVGNVAQRRNQIVLDDDRRRRRAVRAWPATPCRRTGRSAAAWRGSSALPRRTRGSDTPRAPSRPAVDLPASGDGSSTATRLLQEVGQRAARDAPLRADLLPFRSPDFERGDHVGFRHAERLGRVRRARAFRAGRRAGRRAAPPASSAP